MSSALYAGLVTHARFRPKVHRLRYRMLQGLFDLDELPGLDRRLRFFSHNRSNLFSFHDRDHGDGGASLRPWVDRQLTAAGVRPRGLRVRLLCMPRMLGYAFNPLSVYFCSDGDGRLRCLIYQVNNTFGERHSYVMPVEDQAGPVRQGCDKRFYVSPFMEMDLTYGFTVAAPGEGVAVEVAVSDADGPLLDALFAGRRRELTDAALVRSLFTYPLMTVMVVAAIHWHALKLWLKGVRLTRKPGPPAQAVTLPGLPQSAAAGDVPCS